MRPNVVVTDDNFIKFHLVVKYCKAYLLGETILRPRRACPPT